VRDPSFGCSAGGRLAVLIDTDLLIEWGRGETAATFEVLIGDEERALSVITVSEPLHGVYRATGARRTRWADLERRGDPVGAHDLWIAATALTHGFGVASRNRREFERIPGLRVVAPG
jgi:tRNA(fMet)-specific endonuclease VapC